ncbi:MAG: hypothetical protein ABI988_05260 [Nitrospirota bacterium]
MMKHSQPSAQWGTPSSRMSLLVVLTRKVQVEHKVEQTLTSLVLK